MATLRAESWQLGETGQNGSFAKVVGDNTLNEHLYKKKSSPNNKPPF